MALEPISSADRVTMLRTQFDASFALPRQPPAGDLITLLLVGMAQQTSAIRLAELGSFSKCGPIQHVPGQRRECLGVVGHQNRIIPVFQLSVLVSVSDPSPACTWLAISHDAIGFVVSRFLGQIHLQPNAIVHDPVHGSGSIARHAGQAYPIIDLRCHSHAILAASRSTVATSKES